MIRKAMMNSPVIASTPKIDSRIFPPARNCEPTYPM